MARIYTSLMTDDELLRQLRAGEALFFKSRAKGRATLVRRRT